jgi:putative peptidoglycan lipid II flippase
MLPQGIFSVAVATVLFPTLSRLAARGDLAGFGRTVDTGVRQIGFLLVPAGLVSAALAEPITRLLYQRGEFTPDQTPVVAGALAAFSVGLVFNGWMLLLNRAFYGLQQNWIPTLVALGNLGLNVVLFAALYRVGVWGLPLAVSLSNLAGALALAVLMWRRVGGLDTWSTLAALGRIALASVVASGLAVLVWWGLDAELGRSLGAQILSVGLALVVGTGAYLGACRLLGVRELGSLLALGRRGT